ncbi:thioredoxin-like protein [Lentinula raphanica]|uniref:thioredoxin-dependent peroxiredoxin n=1 Tax=Lentinula raphanica TaxID=153919 RepID=A0AA38P1S3_9AGAR|nr:thioredoxin-like protein [Lentinula raphanica]KAJ3776776.1 thioredoxin-like protein [Lentinula raphanica]KAJ3825489.1 thioredoxin-like protein [Lentinula raphanica]KAJ3834695.1 thioredoxin-like protein [Lentinula raphanica]KAJ3972769.1 thioredoxin-like protein [Lentinula raphanica]
MVALIQKPAPAFKSTAVIEGLFEEISLSDYLGKWVVLFFYPMDFTFVCPTEILAFNDALEEFKKIDTVVIGASTDSQYSHFAWASQPRKEGGLGPDLKLPLLADRNMAIARDYGVLLEDEGIALRGLFIIDPKGILRQITVNDLPVGRSVEETLRLVKAFQFTDKHGEVCPAGWSEGGKTIKTDPTAKIEYFSTTGDASSQPSKKRPRTE